MRRLQSYAISALLLVAPGFLRADDKDRPAVRIALVTSDKSDIAHNIMALAEARLSTAPGIVLLERQVIDKVMAEQKLSLGGVVSADQALSIGKLLAVDLFTVVEVGLESKGAAGLVVFDARTGVRLMDTALPANGIAPAVDVVVAAVQAAQQKKQDIAKLRTICLMSVHNGGLPRHLDQFCDSVGLLLERQLSASPDLALLERRRLEQVNQERDLPVDSPLRTLLASVLVVELDVGTTGDSKGLRATALLSDGQKNSLGKVTATVNNRNAADLAQALCEELAKKLNKKLPAVPTPATRSLEACRFLCDRQYFAAHNDVVRAVRATESAFALCPEDVRMRASLAYDLSVYASWVIKPDFSSPLGVASDRNKVDSRAVDLSLSMMHRANAFWIETEMITPESLVPNYVIEIRGSIKIAGIAYWDRLLNLQEQKISEEQLAVINELLAQQKQAFDIRIRRTREAIVDQSSFELYTRELQSFLTSRGRNKYVKDSEWVEQMQQLSEWAALAQKYGDNLSPENMDLIWDIIQSCDLPNQTPAHRQLPPVAVDRLLRLWAELAKNPNRKVALYGRIGGVVQTVVFTRLVDQEAQARLRAVRLAIEADLTNKETLSPGVRYTYYRAATELLARTEMPGALVELKEFCEFMLERKDLYPRLVTATAERHLSTNPLTEDKQRYAFDVLQRSLDLLKSNKSIMISNKDPRSALMEQTSFRNTCLQLQATIRAATPSAGPALEPRWDNVVKLWDVHSQTSGITWILQPVVHSGSIYMTGIRTDGAPARFALQLIRITPELKQGFLGKAVQIADLDFNGQPIAGPDRSRLSRFATTACVHNDCYYLGTQSNGIYVMPFDGSAPVHITTAEGLPSDTVQSLAGSGTYLYACLGDSLASYIVSWDLKAAKCDILASSRRKDKRTPFDDTLPIKCRVMVPDPARHRLILMTTCSRTSRVLSGIWALEPIDGSIKRLLPLEEGGDGLFIESAIIQGNNLILTSAMGILTYDLDKKDPIFRYAGKAVLNADGQRAIISQLEQLSDYHVTTSDFTKVRAPYHVVDDWVWGSYPFSRRSIKDGKAEMLPPLRAGDRAFQPTTIQPFGKDRQLLIADPFTIWLVTLPKK